MNVKLIKRASIAIVAVILCVGFILKYNINKDEDNSTQKKEEVINMSDSKVNGKMDTDTSVNNQMMALRDTAMVNVTDKLTIYSGNTDSIHIDAGEEIPENISYRSEDDSIAEVRNGYVVANREGETNIITSFSLAGKEMSFHTQVTVLAGTVTVSSSELEVMEGTTKKLKTKLDKGVLSGVSYISDNTDVATVVNDGVDGIISGVSNGKATITVTANVSGSITVKEVTVSVSDFDKGDIPIQNPVQADNFTEEDDWQGSRVNFGRFEQDNRISNGKEPILWRVLEVEDNSVLLLAEYGLICKNIHETFEDFTWETSTLRNWLNTSFLDMAFTNQERKAILDSNIDTPDNIEWGTKGGGNTVDKVFLPSVQDVMNPAYGFPANMETSKARMLQCTAYARKNGGYINKDNGNTCWWLRSPGFHQKYADYVFTTGAITENYFIGRRYDAIRPAIRVDLSMVQIKPRQKTGENIYPYISLLPN